MCQPLSAYKREPQSPLDPDARRDGSDSTIIFHNALDSDMF